MLQEGRIEGEWVTMMVAASGTNGVVWVVGVFHLCST